MPPGNPQSGVVIRLHGEDRLLNAIRLTGGRITEPEEVELIARSLAEAEREATAREDYSSAIPPDGLQKQEDAQGTTPQELTAVALSAMPLDEPFRAGGKSDPLRQSELDSRLRDGEEQGTRDEAIREVLADMRGTRQQISELMGRAGHGSVANVPEKDIELEKTLGGD
ncbi:hypothetical protein O3S68_21640 [Kosakonia sp. SOY2]|uniref:hypothetical protein n=1 Tax=Kosakonia sp. SOY2 TaxID=3014557 RepID=UPI0022ABF673|nr:hypothetical protein [Kosakonia sp. SOY2]MCZ3384889.1 hypothetical protein [Kosakonia sp. SOY2]